MKHDQGNVLVVDDNQVNRDLLARRVTRHGHVVSSANNGFQALEMMRSQAFDLVLLDIMMPEMNGYQVLETLKADPALRYIPVIMISAVDDIDSIVRCIELGAEDYLSKPFNPVLLKARINACLEKKRLRDQEQAYLKRLAEEQEKSERLLLNILPAPIAQRLKQGEKTIADSFSEVTVLFGDLVGFTKLSANLSPAELVELLNMIFSRFDELAEKYGLEKIKTIGDAYMIVGGLPTPREDHAEAIAEMALDMLHQIKEISEQQGKPLQIRIGINTGAVEAGVIGTKKFAYDLWGDTVNTAHRMESHGIPGVIQVTEDTYNCLANKYTFQERGMIEIKGKGMMRTYLLVGRKE
ncbi:MAG: adenylate/guanylate cyclase domain-containing protein [Trichodesmium sp. MO_231.B1]|nr:adenylate/guanylate cyclase domain-containing protein [Trichodesmium sp. MO_231.B1]